ncbi:MAG: glycosyltransferase family 4 protein [Patescibacteria group bacterium]
MKILIATGIYPPQIGGPATYSKLLHDKLPSYGFDVVVVNFGTFLWLPKILRHVVYFFWVLVRSVRADLVYAQDPVSVGLPAMLVAKLFRKKFYVKIVGDYAWEQGVQRAGVVDTLDAFVLKHKEYPRLVRSLKRVQCRIACASDRVIVPSEYLKKIVTAWGVPAERIAVIYNGFDVPVIQEEKVDARKKLGMSGHVIVSVGRLVPWKGFVELVEMMPTLLQKIPDVHLFIIGDGPDKKMLSEKIKLLHLEDRISLVGKLSQKELFAYLKAADVFVLNTSYEGFSHQLLEVMALGTPVVTTAVGGNTEIIENKKNGTLVPPNNVGLLSQAIALLHDDPLFAKKLAESAQARVKDFSDERMLKQLAYELAWMK